MYVAFLSFGLFENLHSLPTTTGGAREGKKSKRALSSRAGAGRCAKAPPAGASQAPCNVSLKGVAGATNAANPTTTHLIVL